MCALWSAFTAECTCWSVGRTTVTVMHTGAPTRSSIHCQTDKIPCSSPRASDRQRCANGTAAAELRCSSGTKRVAAVGSIHRARSIDHLMDAMASADAVAAPAAAHSLSASFSLPRLPNTGLYDKRKQRTKRENKTKANS